MREGRGGPEAERTGRGEEGDEPSATPPKGPGSFDHSEVLNSKTVSPDNPITFLKPHL